MDILLFIVEIVKALAWPLGLIATVLILKNPIIDLLKQLKSLNVKGVQLDFGKEILSVAKEASENLPEPAKEPSEKIQKIKKLANLSPRGAILDAWIDVESALKDAAGRHGLTDDKTSPFNARFAMFQFTVSDKIGKGVNNMFEKLYDLRNDVVHLGEISIDSKAAEEFVLLANRLINIFEEV